MIMKDSNGVLLNGPSGIPFIPINSLRTQNINLIDAVIGLVALPAMFLYLSLPLIKENIHKVEALNQTSEGALVEFIRSQSNKELYISFFHPLVIQLLSPLLQDDGSILLKLRIISFTLMSLVFSTFYFITARVNINRLLSVSFIGYMMLLAPVQEYALSNLMENLHLLAILSLFLAWQSIKYSINKCSRWNILVTAASMIMINSKYLGSSMSWVWFITIAMYNLWQNVLPDIKNFKTTKNFFNFINIILFKSTLIPFMVLFLSYSTQIYQSLYTFNNDIPSTLSFMPATYKNLIPGMPQYQYVPLKYGETVVRIRHKESLGGYLSTLPDVFYPSGSGEQIGFLSQLEDNVFNQWQIEAHPSTRFRNGIKNHAKIRLRNVMTGKLLRASSARPPVSDQEYNGEVSLTGDRNFTGDADETWSIELMGNSSPVRKLTQKEMLQRNHQDNQNDLHIGSEFYLVNEGHSCTLLSHDVDLPSHWNKINDILKEPHRQELTCIQSPTRSRTVFRFDSIVHPERNHNEEIQLSTSEKLLHIIRTLPDLLKRFYKYNYYIRNTDFSRARREEDIEADYDYNEFQFQNRVEVGKWMFWQPPNIVNKNYSKFFIGCAFMILMYLVFEILQVLLCWNPFNYTSASILIEKRQNNQITDQWMLVRWVFEDFAFECFLGWLFHYYIFTKSSHWNLDVVLYFPSLFFSILLSLSIFDVLAKWHSIMIVLVPIYLALIF
ncbi:hypothetical protein RNJ44_02671 [Nakaseomyces bracarensis]|uniref:MIR domain-containing protein n=1 Tax=Nakaseomyces bracarensis TaxID=273131 RepID=A0ABR4NZW9_9SACH